MLEMINRLSLEGSPSGDEHRIRDLIRDIAAPMADRVWTDKLGNLLVFKAGKKSLPKPHAISAYMDEPGFMIREITEEGLLRFGMISDTAVYSILGKKVLVGERRLPGVIGLRPIHLTDREDRKKLPREEELYIDLGLEREAVEAQVETGDSGVFAQEHLRIGSHLHYCTGAGKAVGCSALLKLLEETPPVDLLLIFTVQRLVGNRGAYAAAGQGVESVLCVDVCPVEGDSQAELGKGPAIPVMEKNTVFSQRLRQRLLDAGRTAHVSVQALGAVDGRSDAYVYRTAGTGMDAGAVYLPVRGLDGPAQLWDLRDAEALVQLLRGYLNRMEAE